jgi:hypothetical protein
MGEEILAKNSDLPDVKNTRSVYKIWRQLLITSSMTCEGKEEGLRRYLSDCFKVSRRARTGETKGEEDVATAVDSRSASQEISHLLHNPLVHYPVHKSRPAVPILKQVTLQSTNVKYPC